MQGYPKTKSFAAYKREQAKISRHCLYPFTAFYTFNSVLMLALALQTAHPYIAIALYLAGIPVWTFVEYLSHRFILHGRFKRSKHRWKIYKTLANKYLDPSKMAIVIVGDRKVVEPGLKELGYPMTVLDTDGNPVDQPVVGEK